jgi:hypothetical protein
MAAGVRQVVAASCRWCGRSWIARREPFGEFGLGVVALVVQLEQVLGLIRLQLWLLAVQPTLRLGYLHSFPRAHLDQVGFELSHHR